LFSTRTEGVTGSMYELNRCGGAVKGYVKTSGQECVSDVKLYWSDFQFIQFSSSFHSTFLNSKETKATTRNTK
jgi:hypothetical protein